MSVVKYILWTLILVTTALLVVSGVVGQEPGAALLAAVAGLIWLGLEIRQPRDFSMLFFVLFIVLAVFGSLKDVPAPLVLLVVSGSLAAWDLSSFRARTAALDDDESRAALERSHLTKLGIIAGLGFVVALVPLVVQFSISFMVVAALLLVAVIALRVVVSYLRAARDEQ